MKRNSKFKFGKDFESLPLSIQKELFLQNLLHYQQILANLIVELKNEKDKLKENNVNFILEKQNMLRHVEIYENKFRLYSRENTREAYNMIKRIITYIEYYKKKIKNNQYVIKQINTDIDENKKKYYYFYNKYNKLKNY